MGFEVLFAFLQVLSSHSACPGDGGRGETSAGGGLSQQQVVWPWWLSVPSECCQSLGGPRMGSLGGGVSSSPRQQ